MWRMRGGAVLGAVVLALAVSACGSGKKEAAGSSAAGSAGAKAFTDAGCGGCHTLAAAGTRGTVGPNLDQVKPDAARVGGISPFLQIMALADHAKLAMAPHFAMEIHVHLAAAYPHAAWVEHFDWLEPMFEERLAIGAGQMLVPDRPGLGLTLSEQARVWTIERYQIH